MNRSEFEDRTNDWLPSCVWRRRIRRRIAWWFVLAAVFACSYYVGSVWP